MEPEVSTTTPKVLPGENSSGLIQVLVYPGYRTGVYLVLRKCVVFLTVENSDVPNGFLFGTEGLEPSRISLSSHHLPDVEGL